MKKMKLKRSLLALWILTLSFTSIKASEERVQTGNLVMEGIPEEFSQELQERILQYQNIRGAAFRGWGPGGEGMFIGTRFAETAQIHYVASPGAYRQQITFFDEPTRGASISSSKDRNAFIFSKDVGGNENYQIFYYDLDNATYRMLTDGIHRNDGARWGKKGNYVYFRSNMRNGRDYDIYKMPVDNPEKVEMVFEGQGLWANGNISSDGNKMLIMNYVSANESYYYILDMTSGTKTQINPVDKQIAYGSAFFDRETKGVFIVSDEDTEFRHLHYFDIAENKMMILTEDIPWDITDATISRGRKQLAFVANVAGVDQLYIMDTKSKKYKAVKSIPQGIVYGLRFHPDGKKLGMTINTSRSPSDAYVLNLQNMELEQWTFGETGGLNTKFFVEPELIEYPTFDSVDGKVRMITSFYFKPEGNGPFAVIIDIHGGPESQFRPYFNPIVQFLVNEFNIAVLAPNVRGSSGYGKTFLKLDNWELRENSVKDIGSLIDWIESRTELNNDRIGVTGRSYGGYMSLATLIHYNDRIRAGISTVGITNFVTFLENTHPYRQDLRRVEYGDERIPEMRELLHEISPLTNAHKITSPTFIVQGQNDPRVPASEAEQMLNAIKKNGGEVWYLLALDEGHSFSKKSNRDFANIANMYFFKKFLLD